jgi:hypothetical protein
MPQVFAALACESAGACGAAIAAVVSAAESGPRIALSDLEHPRLASAASINAFLTIAIYQVTELFDSADS